MKMIQFNYKVMITFNASMQWYSINSGAPGTWAGGYVGREPRERRKD